MTQEAIWRERVERLENSGMSVRDFAAREGLSRQSLYNWKKRVERVEPKNVKRVAALVPVRVGSTAPPFEVVVEAGRVIVRVPPDFDESALARLLDVLEGER